MPRHSLPTRRLPERPDIDQLKRQAKELLEAFASGTPEAHSEVRAHYRDADRATFALHDAQLVLARAYGFGSWSKLKAYVEGATDQRLVAAVRAHDLQLVSALLKARPELSGRSGALHVAVIERDPELVRLLMEHGANARVGIYPHRDATNPLTMAAERGYDEIIAIIRDEERRRQQTKGFAGAPSDELFEAIRSGNVERALAMMESDPTLIRAHHPRFDWTPLLLAAQTLNARLVAWLVDHGADVMERGQIHPSDDSEQRVGGEAGPSALLRTGQTPLDAAAYWSHIWVERRDLAERLSVVADLLLKGGAGMTARAAVALGNTEWLREQHARGALINRIEESGGLLRIAVSHDHPEILTLLLELGFDPDERTRFRDVGGDEVVFTWGMPLWQCATSGKYEMAEMLLAHGADPNADVYASGTPVTEAYRQRDRKMIELLERHGGVVDAATVGFHGLTERARHMLSDIEAPIDDSGQDVAAQLLGGAVSGGGSEIVRLALEHINWARDDERWFSILEQPIRHGGDLACFNIVLQRCNANIRGRGPFGLSLLHSVAGSSDHVTAEQRLAFATSLLDAGARLDLRDNFLKSTPLGWACRWGRVELVTLFLERGADHLERDAEPWATPEAWANTKNHSAVLAVLRAALARLSRPV
jgi:ankyrin repeat protein